MRATEMPGEKSIIPVVLFAYNRPEHLARTLACLRANDIPLLYAFSDGPRTPDKEAAVAEVRRMLRAIDWCEVVLCERKRNWGLGRSIIAGMTDVFSRHEAALVFEDDLICAPGTYAYLCAALRHYWDNPKVMSVTGWTHPSVTPAGVGDSPYFDGRAESLVWGSWRRVWPGMIQDATALMLACQERGIEVGRYGPDLPETAANEHRLNVWAVRFLYLHILHGGLCLRPARSLVDHIGFDEKATNASNDDGFVNADLPPFAPMPAVWPEPIENPECAALWAKKYEALLRERDRIRPMAILRAARSRLARLFR